MCLSSYWWIHNKLWQKLSQIASKNEEKHNNIHDFF